MARKLSISFRDPRALLRELFHVAVAAADPARLMPGHLPSPPPHGRTLVVGAGKAAASMAEAFEREWNHPFEGLVVTPYGYSVPCRHIEVVEAKHPVPDAAGSEAARRILELASRLGADDLMICLISGGGSALLALPDATLTLEDKRSVNRALLRSGATIEEMNCVRKHLSAIKGGRLAVAAHPARVVTLLISDVPGDDPAVVASGPTIPDSTTFASALDVIHRRRIEVPSAVREYLELGAGASRRTPTDAPLRSQRRPIETPKPGDHAFAADSVLTLATAADSLAAAAERARKLGISPVLLGDDLEGEARELGAAHAALAIGCAQSPERERARLRQAVDSGVARALQELPRAPLVLLSGGETTVTVRGSGRGGRNSEYQLGLALALRGQPGVFSLAADTDGIDGSETNAGAFVTPDTLERLAMATVNPDAALQDNDAYGAFSAIGDLLVTGPTRTNVNDFRAILVLPT